MLRRVLPLSARRTLRFIAIFVIFFELDFAVGKTLTRNYWTKSLKLESHRSERYLVYPTPAARAPTKVQLITGLGLPMEVDVSMIVGYVMKFNYALPYNASYLTHPYVSRYDRSIDRHSGLVYREKNNDERTEQERDGVESPTRWEIYRVIESALEGFRVSGKGCLLRTVCQLAEVPFEETRSGIFGELIHILLTPSTTREKYEATGDQEYHSAEAAGRDNPGKCENLFPECDHNLLEYFTETNVIEEVMEEQGFFH